METADLCTRYLAALDAGDLDAVLALFAPGAQVVSPLYGTLPAPDFYRALFADTARSKTHLLNIFTADNGSLALHFRYDWTLADGTLAPFEVVDVIELATGGTGFARLTILYDTAPLRPGFEAVHRRS